jgi:hypothetical protein
MMADGRDGRQATVTRDIAGQSLLWIPVAIVFGFSQAETTDRAAALTLGSLAVGLFLLAGLPTDR